MFPLTYNDYCSIIRVCIIIYITIEVIIIDKKICSFFGHRDTSERIYESLYREIIKAIKTDGVSVFYVGNNGAFDSLARRAVMKAKEEFEGIKICLVLAYMPIKKDSYIAGKYDGTIYPDGLEFVPKRFAISHRNKWIIQQSDMVIGYVRTSYGGAYDALHYAKNQKKKVINLGEQNAKL